VDDAIQELLTAEDILEFGDERSAGEEAEALLAGGGEYGSRCAAPQEC